MIEKFKKHFDAIFAICNWHIRGDGRTDHYPGAEAAIVAALLVVAEQLARIAETQEEAHDHIRTRE